jgi:hypothetical protein
MFAFEVKNYFNNCAHAALAANITYACMRNHLKNNNIPFLYQKSIELYTNSMLKACIDHDIYKNCIDSKNRKILLIQMMRYKSFWEDIEKRWSLLQQS